MAFLERLAGREPGQPRTPELPGAPPTASKPAAVKNPPAAAAGPVGRPPLPAPSFPGGAGRSLPTSPTARPAAPPTARPAQGPQQPQPAAAPAPVGMPTDQLIQSFDRVPTSSEILDVPEGVKIMTPYGEVGRDGKLSLSPEGELKFKEAMVNRRKQFGPHPFAGDANAPAAPARLGGRMFNPFSGQWVD